MAGGSDQNHFHSHLMDNNRSRVRLLLEQDQSVLFAGLVCLDIINVLDEFPVEDLGHRCSDCRWQRGGNASNSATVFSLLGGKTCFFGTLAKDDQTLFLLNDFGKCKISLDKCPKIDGSSCPLSVVILNSSLGTRTVLHTNKNLRELTLKDLTTHLDLKSDSMGWIHFEGRDNALNIFQMITYIIDFNEKQCAENKSGSNGTKPRPIITSLEAEKIRLAPGMDQYNMWQLPDVLFVSKDFAKSQGFLNMKDAAQGYFQKVKQGGIIICAWGELGAAAMSEEEGLVQSNAFPPSKVIDSCGAGDTFNASVIRALSEGRSLKDSITFGCKIAGGKCGFLGYDGVQHL